MTDDPLKQTPACELDRDNRIAQAETMMPGPCIICGLSNYPLSAGGPTICPSCDCGDFGITKIKRQRDEVERLRAESEAFRGKLAEQCGQTLVVRAEVEQLKAENARLKEGWATAFNIGVSEQEQNKQLRDEVARLKEIEIRYDQLISGAFI